LLGDCDSLTGVVEYTVRTVVIPEHSNTLNERRICPKPIFGAHLGDRFGK
jgi:hypothetical protein